MLYPLSYWGLCQSIVQCFSCLVKLRAAAVPGRRPVLSSFQRPVQRKTENVEQPFGHAALHQQPPFLRGREILQPFEFLSRQLVLTEPGLEGQIAQVFRRLRAFKFT